MTNKIFVTILIEKEKIGILKKYVFRFFKIKKIKKLIKKIDILKKYNFINFT